MQNSPSGAAPRIDGLLVVGHGTRDESGRGEFFDSVQLVRQRAASLSVEAGFLELCSPGIDEAIELLCSRGARRIVAAPLMLFAAAHVKRDIPAALAAAAAKRPGLAVSMTPHLGLCNAIAELSQLRFRDAVAGALASGDDSRLSSAGKRLLLLVGRGSTDPEATAEMREFAERRRAAFGIGDVEAAFLALAQPTLDKVLPRLAASDYRQIVVQPHLLFQGELLGRLQRQVAELQANRPSQQWTLTRHLGPHPLLAEAILEVCDLDHQEKHAASAAPVGRNK